MLPEELDRQCRDGRIQGIYLIPTCSNPTTITLSLARRQALAEVIRQNHLILLEDDISTWLYAPAGLGLPSLFDLLQGQSIYICGMTKSLCPGLRIAYVAFADRFRAPLLHGLTNVNLKTSSFDAQNVITELLLSGKAYQIAAQRKAMGPTERPASQPLLSRQSPPPAITNGCRCVFHNPPGKWSKNSKPWESVSTIPPALPRRRLAARNICASPCALPGAPAAWSRDSEFCNTISKNTPRHSGEKPITGPKSFLPPTWSAKQDAGCGRHPVLLLYHLWSCRTLVGRCAPPCQKEFVVL